jgi:hypothetical protein
VQALQHNTVVKCADVPLISSSFRSAMDSATRHDTAGSYSHWTDTLRSNTGLDTLVVRVSTELADTDAAWMALARGLQHNARISSLEVVGSYNGALTSLLSYTASRALGSVLESAACGLTRLTLRSLTLAHQGLDALCQGLASNVSLRVLELQHLEWDDETELWMPLLKAVARTKASLQRLSIVECDLDLDRYGSESTDCDTNDDWNVGHDNSEHHLRHPLYTLVSRPGTTLRDLRITECQLGMAELEALCQGLQVSSCLVQRLDLSGCDHWPLY